MRAGGAGGSAAPSDAHEAGAHPGEESPRAKSAAGEIRESASIIEAYHGFIYTLLLAGVVRSRASSSTRTYICGGVVARRLGEDYCCRYGYDGKCGGTVVTWGLKIILADLFAG